MSTIDFIMGLRFVGGDLAVIAYRWGSGVEVALGNTEGRKRREVLWREEWHAELSSEQREEIRARVLAAGREIIEGAELEGQQAQQLDG